MSTPIRGMRPACCARAASGHAAALPRPAMTSRRRILVSPGFMAAYAQDSRAPCSEIRCVRRGNRGIRAQKMRIFGADRLRPVADEAPISDLPRPGRSENGRVLHRELDLQTLLAGVGVDDAPSVRRIDPITRARTAAQSWRAWRSSAASCHRQSSAPVSPDHWARRTGIPRIPACRFDTPNAEQRESYKWVITLGQAGGPITLRRRSCQLRAVNTSLSMRQRSS
jgi:hypothetical protein